MDFIFSFFKQPENGIPEKKQNAEFVLSRNEVEKNKWKSANSLECVVVDSTGKEAELRKVYGQKIRFAMWDDNLMTQIFVKPGKEAGTYVSKGEVLRQKEEASQLQCK